MLETWNLHHLSWKHCSTPTRGDDKGTQLPPETIAVKRIFPPMKSGMGLDGLGWVPMSRISPWIVVKNRISHWNLRHFFGGLKKPRPLLHQKNMKVTRVIIQCRNRNMNDFWNHKADCPMVYSWHDGEFNIPMWLDVSFFVRIFPTSDMRPSKFSWHQSWLLSPHGLIVKSCYILVMTNIANYGKSPFLIGKST